MKLPDKYHAIILSGMEPGKAYQKCINELLKDNNETDYHLTETLVYATEIRYAIDILNNGHPDSIWNFGDLKGDADAKLFELLTPLLSLNIAFVGSGPYPVTSLILNERFPQAKISCIDNNITAHFLSQAVFEKLKVNISTHFAEAIDVDYQNFNVVIVAAMISGKHNLVEKILSESNALIIVRGSVDLEDARLIQFDSQFRDDGALG